MVNEISYFRINLIIGHGLPESVPPLTNALSGNPEEFSDLLPGPLFFKGSDKSPESGLPTGFHKVSSDLLLVHLTLPVIVLGK
jgi:hypothetical protein